MDFARYAELLPINSAKKRIALSLEQSRALVAACAGNADIDLRERAVVVLALRTGIRRAGICALNVEDLRGRTLTVRLKGGRDIEIVLHDDALPLEEGSDGRCRWWTFGGGGGNRVLAGLLERELGECVSPGNTFITFSNGAAESAVASRQAIDALAVGVPLAWSEATRLVDPGQRSRVSKFQPCLPPEIEHGLIARETMSVDDANATLGEWKRRLTRQEVES